jgi:hypothetical protein
MMGVQQFCQPPYLGSGEVKGRYHVPLVPPKPLPWYYTNQTAVTYIATALVFATVAAAHIAQVLYALVEMSLND